ncbi:glycosyltransferase family 4 protein [Hydrogenophaga sp. RWCD_12]|uniref:glycosyltransferase family 4 protein n=1 Tax=Hydrogenophaga sp. RWCD_12 TaxID=3391190 RepID=UPI0039853DA0
MKILLVTDAWQPQVNGVVTTLVELVRQVQSLGHEVVVIHPAQFRTRPCPGYAGIDLALFPGRRLRQLIDEAQPDAIHIATEGPLGWAARRHCLRRKLPFTTAYHTRFPEMLHVALKVPLSWAYALFRRFHRPSQGVLVPTSGVMDLLRQRGFANLREWTHGVDTALFGFLPEPRACAGLGDLPRPVSLFVGRLSHEKNIQAYLDLDIPGSKVVCGVGPLEASLRERYPDVHWVGALPRRELVEVYGAADVFVFPSLHETFGLVMLEAMSCGVPVAAFPVDGPLQVIADSPGGVMRNDLRQAWSEALKIPRQLARGRALEFGWDRAAELFLGHLVPLAPRRRSPRSRPHTLNEESAVLALQRIQVSQERHPLVE